MRLRGDAVNSMFPRLSFGQIGHLTGRTSASYRIEEHISPPRRRDAPWLSQRFRIDGTVAPAGSIRGRAAVDDLRSSAEADEVDHKDLEEPSNLKTLQNCGKLPGPRLHRSYSCRFVLCAESADCEKQIIDRTWGGPAMKHPFLSISGAMSLALALAILGCGGRHYGQSSLDSHAASNAAILQSKHVVMVMESENQSYSTVVGHTSVWPNRNALIDKGALATHYYSNSHPSIGNYFMLTTGQLLTTNDNSTKVWNVANIARRMLAEHVSFRIYAEGIKQGHLGGNTGLCLIRHNPFAMLSDIADSKTVADTHIFPFTQFAIDLANGNVPEYSYIIPDIEDDADNGTPHAADAWLQKNVVPTSYPDMPVLKLGEMGS